MLLGLKKKVLFERSCCEEWVEKKRFFFLDFFCFLVCYGLFFFVLRNWVRVWIEKVNKIFFN